MEKTCPFCKEPKKGGFLSACPHCGKIPAQQFGLSLTCLGCMTPIFLIVVLAILAAIFGLFE